MDSGQLKLDTGIFEKQDMRSAMARDSLLAGCEALMSRDFAGAARAFDRGTTLDPDNPALLHGAAVAARRLGDLGAAEAHYRAAIVVAERRTDDPATNVLAITLRLVELYRRQGRDDEAQALCLRVLCSRHTGQSAIALSRLYVCLAEIYRRRGQFAAAAHAYRAAIKLRGRIFGDRHPKTVQILSPLSDVCRQLGRYDEADDLARRSRTALGAFEHKSAAGHA
ncbi:MAG: tetratricopeptide repeat protein [Rhodospirillales bacterium]|nr:MAG: tetratricopeptide repeat protein [Rhodospirillales bacterium]